MKFDYIKYPAPSTPAFPDRRESYRPTILIKLKYKGRSVELFALVDSGADCCVFPSGIGEQLGMDIKSGPVNPMSGFGEKRFPVYFHDVQIVVGRYEIQAWAGFCDEIPMPILGQNGFFDPFEVRFDFRKKQLEVTR
jgi:hypothetical protein